MEHTDGIHIFSASMQRDQFIDLQQCIPFDKRETRNERSFEDKFAPLRNIMEMFSTKCRSNYNPSPYLTIDEQQVTFRGCCPFKILYLRLVNSSIFGFQNDSNIVSYVPKKNKAVILLSTFHNNNEIVIDQNEKPRIILDYNKYKGGVDTLDQVIRCYSSC